MKEVKESPKQFHREIQHNKRPPHSLDITRPNMRFFFCVILIITRPGLNRENLSMLEGSTSQPC